MLPPLTRRAFALSAAAVATAPRFARAEDTIKIGVVFPSTGPAAEAGRLQLNGARQALESVNEKGVLAASSSW